MADIFISYASEDGGRVKPLAKALMEQGWSVWWDHTITPGKTWRDVIGTALDDARCIVVLWSKQSIDSHWVITEADFGLRKRILIPALLELVEPPLGFGHVQSADLTEWKAETDNPEFAILLDAISEIAGPSPLRVKETKEKRVEEERRLKEDQERKLREEKQRKAEEEWKLLQKENRI